MGVVVIRCCSVHTGNEVSSCVDSVVEQLWWSCVHFGHCESCVVFVVMLMGFWWTSSGQSTLD